MGNKRTFLLFFGGYAKQERQLFHPSSSSKENMYKGVSGQFLTLPSPSKKRIITQSRHLNGNFFDQIRGDPFFLDSFSQQMYSTLHTSPARFMRKRGFGKRFQNVTRPRSLSKSSSLKIPKNKSPRFCPSQRAKILLSTPERRGRVS